MCEMGDGLISNVMKKNGRELQSAWTRDLTVALPSGKGRISGNELDAQTSEFLQLLAQAAQQRIAADARLAGNGGGPGAD